jgi:hypothetical protein
VLRTVGSSVNQRGYRGVDDNSPSGGLFSWTWLCPKFTAHCSDALSSPAKVGAAEDESSAAVPMRETTPALSDKPSIAVLSFENLSDDPEQEYFADGVVEEIITGLARIKGLLVIARNSSFTYRGLS